MSEKEPISETKILVVDDDPSVGQLIADFLLSEGCQPVICGHPQQAMDFIKEEPVSLAFVDINMPEMNGIELASKIKEQLPLCGVVFITGYGTFNNAVQAIKVGAYDYLRKPFGISELKLCLKRFQERQELRNKVRRVEQRYFNLVQNIPSLVFIIRKDFSLDFINRACEPMLGFTPEEALNNRDWLRERLHRDDLQRIESAFMKAFQKKNLRFSEECRLIHKDGHTIHAMIGSILLAESEQSQGTEQVQGMIVDITDRVFLEKAVIQREKLKILSAISAEVAHGIRNPLVSIGGFARRLRKRFEDLPEGDIILKESKRLENILKRIAEYLKPVEVSYQECSINNIVSDCVKLVSEEMEGGDLRYQLNLHPSLTTITIDKEILTRIFTDLIRNARNVMGGDGKLYISTFESNKNCHIEFKKTGEKPGNDDLEPFLLPFNSSDKEFGLPLSYRLLKNMGGLLSYSKGEKEIIFTVSLPKHPTPAENMDGLIMN